MTGEAFKPGWDHLPAVPLNAGGYLRSLHMVFDGVATTGGPFGYEPTRFRRARTTQRRCPDVWASNRCQRRRNHTGLHWWAHRKRQAWWGQPDDAPFNVIDSYREAS